MKKLNAIWLLLTVLFFASAPAAALTTTVEWDIPGSVMIKTDSNSGPFVDLTADQTSYVFTTDATYGYIYLYAAEGYTLIDAATTDGSNTYTPNTWSTPPFISVYVGQGNGMNGKTVKVNCIKTERNDTFTVDIINGLDFLSATFASGYSLDLKQGINTYNFNPLIDGNLTIKLDGISSAYSVTLDGTPVEKSAYGANYTVKINPQSQLSIRVFESEADIPKDCKLTFEFGENMAGCIYSISNRTTNKLYEPSDLVNNSITFKGGNEIRVNLIGDDYSYTNFTLDGADITDDYNTYQNYIAFTLPNQDSSVLKIEGTATVYEDIDFTGYIAGAEGVNFSLTFNGESIAIPEGEAITEDIQVGSYTLTPANARKYTIPVSAKVGKIFFSPKDGYYIAELYTSTGSSMEQHSGSASIVPDLDGTTFYMVVKKLESAYSFDVTTTGSTYTGKLSSANQAIMDSWNNPDGLNMTLSQGNRNVAFYPGYDVPALISVYGNDTMDPAVYLDGAPLTGVVNSNSAAKEFTFDPYSPTENDGIAEGVKSDVQVYLSTSRPTMSGASLVLEDGANAGFFYSAVRHQADPAGQSVISGTTMIVKPASTSSVVKFKGQTVTLDDNGEFVFEVTGSPRNNVVTVSGGAKYTDMLVNPADGATVKSLSTVKITLPCIDPNYESMLDYNEEVLPLLKVKKGNDVVAEFGELGDPSEDSDGNTIIPIILSNSITEAGTYTISIPEGAFVEKAWSEAEQAMVVVAGGFVTPAYNGSVTVDPQMVSICDDFTLDPANGSSVSEISVVKVTFNQISSEEYFSGWEFPNATFTNGDKTVQAIVNYDWMSESENRVMTVTPIDADEEFVPIAEAGTWTMTIAPGTFSFNGESNGEITAKYTISDGSKYADMLVNPADGAVVKSLSTIKITLPCIDPNYESMLDYNEEVLPLLTVKDGDEVVAEFGELGEPSEDSEGNTIVPIILSKSITEAGTYTIDIPEKAFVEKAWSDLEDGMVVVEGGFVTPAYTGTVIVNPNAASVCDDYTLDPANGSSVSEISVVKITFNQISAEEYFSGWEFPNATFTNGDSTVEAIVNYDWMGESENRVMTVTPIDAEEEFTPITEAGKWTMTIGAGTFSFNGESNGVITAEYTVGGVATVYPITPESGSVVDNLSEIKIEFPGVTEVEYNDLPVTLNGTEYNASSTDVLGTGNSRTVYFRNPTKDGEYTVTFPAGAFTLDGEASKEATAFYTFQSSYVLTPESGSTLEEFEVAVSFPHATDVELVGDLSSILLTNNRTYASPSMNCVKDESASVPTFLLTIPEDVQQPPIGSYDLIIDEGMFMIDGKPSVSIFANYTIDHDVTAEYTLSPENGVIVYQDWGYDFAVIFDESATLSRPNASKIEVALDGNPLPASAYELGVEMNMLMFVVLDPTFCKEGVLTLNVGAGAFNIGSTPNPAIQAQWTLIAPQTFSVILTPEENDESNKLEEIEIIYVTFPDATSGEIYNENGATLRSSNYTYFSTGEVVKIAPTEARAESGSENHGVTFAITFEKTDEAGIYNLNVREGMFVLDGVHNSPEINAVYYIDPTVGIGSRFADENGNVTVFSIDGHLILENVPAAEIRNLESGLYIINGVKVVLK